MGLRVLVRWKKKQLPGACYTKKMEKKKTRGSLETKNKRNQYGPTQKKSVGVFGGAHKKPTNDKCEQEWGGEMWRVLFCRVFFCFGGGGGGKVPPKKTQQKNLRVYGSGPSEAIVMEDRTGGREPGSRYEARNARGGVGGGGRPSAQNEKKKTSLTVGGPGGEKPIQLLGREGKRVGVLCSRGGN